MILTVKVKRSFMYQTLSGLRKNNSTPAGWRKTKSSPGKEYLGTASTANTVVSSMPFLQCPVDADVSLSLHGRAHVQLTFSSLPGCCCYYMLQHIIVTWMCWSKITVSISSNMAWKSRRLLLEGRGGAEGICPILVKKVGNFCWGSTASWACQTAPSWCLPSLATSTHPNRLPTVPSSLLVMSCLCCALLTGPDIAADAEAAAQVWVVYMLLSHYYNGSYRKPITEIMKTYYFVAKCV